METKCWKYLIEELIQKDLPENVDVKKSFFPKGDFGDLFFVVVFFAILY